VLVACEPSRQPAVRSALEAHGGRIAEFAFRPHGVEAIAGDRRWSPS
jgi:hypothetical protein